ncbi:MAG: protein-L-isoaspartate(D-aspartate) O-methyltransferase [Pseudomonadota bacterium]
MGILLAASCRGGGGSTPAEDPSASARARMVAEQLAGRDITDPRVLDAMRRVQRHRFVPERLESQACRDHPLPIGHDQTISQPYIVAFMSQALALRPEDRVLEIGTGSGYQAAILGELVREVFSIEIVEPLGEQARETLKVLGYENVHVRIGDGTAGWPEEAPFDKIMLTAAPVEVPKPLLEQMAVGGLLVAPVGEHSQELVLIRRHEQGWERRSLLGVRFVPMTGRALER